MSARAARAFLPALRQLDGQLSVPIPERVRILRELEYDLEELRDRFLAQGLTAEEARGRALDALLPDGLALQELGRLHAPFYRRVTRQLSVGRVRVVERSALVVATGSVLLAETFVLLRAELLESPSSFLWPVLGLGGLLIATILASVYELWIARDHRSPGRSLGAIVAVAGAALATGVGGVLVDFYRLAVTLERSPELAGTLLPLWLVRDAALLSVAMLLALAGGLAWFVLTKWVALVSEAHRQVLGLIPTHGHRKERKG